MTEEKVWTAEEKASRFLLIKKQNKIMLLIHTRDPEKWKDYYHQWKKMLKKLK